MDNDYKQGSPYEERSTHRDTTAKEKEFDRSHELDEAVQA